MKLLEELAARRRLGMRPGLDAMRRVLAALGDPQLVVRPVHIAGTNGKGAVAAIVDAALGDALRYTSPHLVRLNERFTRGGVMLDDATLERAAARVFAADAAGELTFFESLTAVAFLLAAEMRVPQAVFETGLGGRLDATNVCRPRLAVITRIGLDHCDWLGDTLARIAAEKAGIIKPGVSVVVGANAPEALAVIRAAAARASARFVYAPDIVTEAEIPADFALRGSFNRENAVTAIAALKTLLGVERLGLPMCARIATVRWPGRFERLGGFLVDGAHNPPGAAALVAALCMEYPTLAEHSLELVFGCCADKDADAVIALLAPFVRRVWTVATHNPRALAAPAVAAKFAAAGVSATACGSVGEALARTGADLSGDPAAPPAALVCGSLFLVGEALAALAAAPASRPDPSEALEAL